MIWVANKNRNKAIVTVLFHSNLVTLWKYEGNTQNQVKHTVVARIRSDRSKWNFLEICFTLEIVNVQNEKPLDSVNSIFVCLQ